MAAEGLGRSVADQVKPQFATRRFDGLIDFPDRGMKALGHNLEVIDQCLNGGLHALAVRQDDVRRVSFHRPFGQAVDGLLHNAERLAHFLDPHQVTRVHVAFAAGWNLEIKLFVARIGLPLSEVPVRSGAPQRGAR